MKKISIFIFLIILSTCERTIDNGEIIKFYGDAKEDIGYSIAASGDAYYMAGQLTEITRTGNQIVSSAPRPGLIRTDFDGNVTWKEFVGGRLKGFFTKVIVLGDGSVAAAGQVTDTISKQSDIFLFHAAADGNLIAQNQVKLGGNQTSKDIIQTSDGFIVLGTTDAERAVTADSVGNYAGNTDILVLRIGNDLTLSDTPKPLGFPGNDVGVAIKKDPGGGYIIAGTTDRYLSKGRQNDMFLWKINAFGAATNPDIIAGTDNEYAADMEVTDDGYLIGGTVKSSASADSIIVEKIAADLSSGPLFKRKFGSTADWNLGAISAYKSSSFVLAGTEGSSSQSKMLVFAINADGRLLYDQVKITGSSGVQVSYDVVSDQNDDVIAIGSNTYGSNSLITLLKFRF
jgi:hypothetical protein